MSHTKKIHFGSIGLAPRRTPAPLLPAPTAPITAVAALATTPRALFSILLQLKFLCGVIKSSDDAEKKREKKRPFPLLVAFGL